MKQYCSIIFLVFISLTTFSQGRWKQNYHRKSYYDTLPHYKYTVRVSPLSMIDVLQPSLTVGGEWHFSNTASVGLDISGLIPINIDDTKKWGFIIKPSLKLFIPSANSIASNFFIEPDIFWKRQLKNEDGWLGKNAVNNNPAYFEFKNYTLIKDVFGANIKIGSQTSLGPKNLMLEFYLGFGVRNITKHIKNEPNAFIQTERNQLFGTNGIFGSRNIDQTYWAVSFPLGVRIAYIIK